MKYYRVPIVFRRAGYYDIPETVVENESHARLEARRWLDADMTLNGEYPEKYEAWTDEPVELIEKPAGVA